MTAVNASFPYKEGQNWRILGLDYWLVKGGVHDFDGDNVNALVSNKFAAHLMAVTSFLCKNEINNKLIFFLNFGCIPTPIGGKIEQTFLTQIKKISGARGGLNSDSFKSFALNIDYFRCRLPILEETVFTDPNKGVWELWPCKTNKLAEKIKVDGLVAANPEDAIRDEYVCIDFGTSSTVVAIKTNGKPGLLRIGVNDFFQPIDPEHYENPTLLEFINLKKMLEDFTATPYLPLVNWDDVHCSHEALGDWRNAETNTAKIASILPRLKQWALNSRDMVIPIRGYADKTEMELPQHKARLPVMNAPLAVSSSDPFDPIELYAWFLGLNINWRSRGIFLNYYMTFPVRYSNEIKNNILASFARGLQRSLPIQIVEGTHFSKFSVEEKGSEPAAYAAAALPALGLDPTLKGVAYAVFDFGGGTTDFDFGYYRLPTEAELHEEPYLESVLEHFGASGDNHLGGESLLEAMAFRVFCDNKKLLAEKHITFPKPIFEQTFPGSETLIDRSQAAITNQQLIMSKLRPLWEKSKAVIGESGVLKLNLLNHDGKEESCELVLSIDKLKGYLVERIRKGVQEFLVAMKSAFESRGTIPATIHVLLAGNASRSSIVQDLFGLNSGGDKAAQKVETVADPKSAKPPTTERSKAGKDSLAEMYPIFKQILPHPPLDADPGHPERPTAKTGVALGLLNMTPGETLKVVSRSQLHGESPFLWFVGGFRMKRFETILPQHVNMKEWRKLGHPAQGAFVLAYTSAPATSSEKSPRGDATLIEKRITLHGADPKSAIWVQAIGPNTIETCVSAAEPVNKATRSNIHKFELTPTGARQSE